MKTVSLQYSKFQNQEITPTERWEQKSADYCKKSRVTMTALEVIGNLTLFAFTGVSIAAAATASKDDSDDIQAGLGITGSVFGACLSIVCATFTIGDLSCRWRSDMYITRYAVPEQMVKLRDEFLNDDIKSLTEKYQNSLSHFYRIGILTDDTFERTQKLFCQQQHITKNKNYLEQFDPKLIDDYSDLKKLAARTQSQQMDLDKEWNTFRNETFAETLPSPVLVGV